MYIPTLSLGGPPPFLGFLPKLNVNQDIIKNNIAPLATVVLVTSLITLYYYLIISYSRFIIFKHNIVLYSTSTSK
jgi:NADH-ubiquinone oxidoreductase chain 2